MAHDEAPVAAGSPGGEASADWPLLAVRNLCKYYRQFPAVGDVSFDVRAGEIVGLVGPNGAGKTTILRCIAGILRPTYGGIWCGGHAMPGAAHLAKRLNALIPETPNLYELLTVTEHLRFIHMAYGETEPFAPRAEALLQRLELWEKRDAVVATLSKGMKQKVAIACAFIHSARIFLFDEPFIGIDPAGQRTVRNLMAEAAQGGGAVLISSHILDTVEQLCDRVLVLSRGALLAEGTLDELRTRAQRDNETSLEDVFLTLTGVAEEG